MKRFIAATTVVIAALALAVEPVNAAEPAPAAPVVRLNDSASTITITAIRAARQNESVVMVFRFGPGAAFADGLVMTVSGADGAVQHVDGVAKSHHSGKSVKFVLESRTLSQFAGRQLPTLGLSIRRGSNVVDLQITPQQQALMDTFSSAVHALAFDINGQRTDGTAANSVLVSDGTATIRFLA